MSPAGDYRVSGFLGIGVSGGEHCLLGGAKRCPPAGLDYLGPAGPALELELPAVNGVGVGANAAKAAEFTAAT
jgi:hypothetical protein